MASYIRPAVEAFIRKLMEDVLEHIALVPLNEYYEIKQVPSLLLIGPKIAENLEKRSSEKLVDLDVENLLCTSRNWPSYYHLDFDFLLTAATGAELLDLQERLLVFFIDNREVVLDDCRFRIAEIVPIGGLDRPNLSNLRQASGKYRIEDVTVFGNEAVEEKIVLYREFRLCDMNRRLIETYKPDETG